MIGFAHRGAPRTRREENTLPAFRRALDLGADGLESDIGLTADGVPVLIHAGISPRGLTISRLRRADLPDHVPTLSELYRACGSHFHLSLDMAAPRAAESVVQIAAEREALCRLWLTYWRLPALEEWRKRWPEARLVHPAMPLRRRSAEQLMARLETIGVDALNVHWRLCRPWLVEAAHERGLLVFAWGVKSRSVLERVVPRGIDGVYCDDAEALGSLHLDASTELSR